MHPRVRSLLALAAAAVVSSLLALAVAACGPSGAASLAPTGTPGDVDPVSRALLEAYDQEPTGPTSVEQVTVGDADDLPWALYLEASRRANLDFSRFEGAAAELRVTPVAGSNPDAKAYVLVRGGQAIGAWIGPGGSTSGVLSLADAP